MAEPDLVERLRATREHSDLWWVSLCELAADQIEKLRAVAHAAWHALEDSGDVLHDADSVEIMRKDYDELAAALDDLCGEGGDIHDVIRGIPERRERR